MSKDYRILLYYKYVTIENGPEFAEEHLNFCNELGLKGRIIIADEGINGTVSGKKEQTEKYKEVMWADPRFSDLWFKEDASEGHAFPKMKCRYRKELVTLRLEYDIDPLEKTGEYLNPKEFYEEMQKSNTVVIDARNDYEYDLGHFKGAIRPDIETFKDLPDWIREHKKELKDKKILTYCTGGVRCEKFSGWLKEEGFEDVGQLHGGIVSYGKDPEVKGKDWHGQCYVFDERISVPINQEEHVVVGKDYFTGEPCERYVNCANPECNKKIICSEESEHKYLRSCCHDCRIHQKNRFVEEHKLSEQEWNGRTEAIQRNPRITHG
ncbi:MAG: rhodanese-related sulfurtransferase [Bacillus sp. (in: Bacteria)]|nr:rhodanese-related sulfurtransferase [Bacillus sp. (in: firmicutes)]